jgi:hypothetical protein
MLQRSVQNHAQLNSTITAVSEVSFHASLLASRQPNTLRTFISMTLPQTSSISRVIRTLSGKHNSEGRDSALRTDSDVSHGKGTGLATHHAATTYGGVEV